MAAIISSSDGLFFTISTKSSADMSCSSRNILSCGHGYMYSPMMPCSFALALSEILANQGIPPMIISRCRGFQSSDMCFTSFYKFKVSMSIPYYFLEVVLMFALNVQDVVRIPSNCRCVVRFERW